MDDQVAAKRPRIADREDDYRKQRLNLLISPAREDPFDANTEANPYRDVMLSNKVHQDELAINHQLKTKVSDGTLNQTKVRRRNRWDQAADGKVETPTVTSVHDSARSKTSDVVGGITPRTKNQWDETPGRPLDPSATPGQLSVRQWAETPAHISDFSTPGRELGGVTPSVRHNRFDETPHTDRIGSDTPGLGSGWSETPRADRTPGTMSVRDDISTVHDTPGTVTSKKRTRWDETPLQASITPNANCTPGNFTPSMTPNVPFTPGGITPIGDKARMMATPAYVPCTPEQMQAFKWQREIDERNRSFSDAELDELLPPGYRIIVPQPGYVQARGVNQRLIATPTPMGTPAGFKMMTPDSRKGGSGGGLNNAAMGDLQPAGDLPLMRPDDIQYFNKLLDDVDEESLTASELKEREIMKLLLKIKNGTPPIRKSAMRQITSKAKEFGPKPLLNQILPLLMSPTLEDQERHLLVKVIDRILYKLEDKVRPYVHKILVVIEPLLIDEDYYARQEGREIISNLAKAAGLASMISTLRPDIDNMDEYVRNTTARAFAVVAHALGIPHLLPFLKAVCRSKKSWQARHTGIKIIQQIAILMGCAILPHLRSLVEIIEHGLVDDQQKVRTITALALSALAEASTPYGIESFDSVLKPLWKGIRQHRGKGLAAFLKAIGYLIPLMDKDYASYYTKEVMIIVIREFQSPDEEMKKIVLKVVKQCCGTEGVTADYIKNEILPPFFRHFWNQRMAMDRRNSSQLVETTVEIAGKVGAVVILTRIVDDLKDESEPYRKMVIETIEKVLEAKGAADTIDTRLEEQLIDGILYAFQEQNSDQDSVLLNGFGSIVTALGVKAKPYTTQISTLTMFRMQNRSPKVRQQSADLLARLVPVLKACNEQQKIYLMGQTLYEYLGEEYPEVLGSIIAALKTIVLTIGVEKMNPRVSELLPRLTPILKNRHEKVQENCIELVGVIADRGHDSVSGREWMRICFELLELLKAHKKSIRRATVNTFGYIAKAVGPHDVLATLLNNLKVQERQNRVCTTVAIAIVADTCYPFTVLPALMNEFRVADLNVQNGVLKSLSFMFEYVGEMAKDYIYAVTPLLEDALIDRDLVHRQTAISAVAHMTLGVFGYGCEDALTHLLNLVWPNVLETSPHIVQAFVQCLEAMRCSLGSGTVSPYVYQGLFHPAKKVRDIMWKIYNSLYIGNPDAMVAGFPRIKNDQKNQYIRYELQYAL